MLTTMIFVGLCFIRLLIKFKIKLDSDVFSANSLIQQLKIDAETLLETQNMTKTLSLSLSLSTYSSANTHVDTQPCPCPTRSD